MDFLICPYCRIDDIPRGATVCRGCQAEIEYGMPPASLGVTFVAACIVGIWVSGRTAPLVGWIAFGAVCVGGIYGSVKLFRERIVFKRRFNTR